MTRRQKGTLREEQKRFTQQRLLEAARETFGAAGYAGATVDDIARAAGTSRATFYLHFDGKLDALAMLTASLMPGATGFYRDLDEVLERGDRGELRDWFVRAIGWFVQHRDLLPAMDEAMAVEREYRVAGRKYIAMLVDAMPRYLARHAPEDADDARLRIELLLFQLERYFARWVVLGTAGADVERTAEVLTGIWFPALAAREPAVPQYEQQRS